MFIHEGCYDGACVFVTCLKVGGAFVTNGDARPETAARARALIRSPAKPRLHPEATGQQTCLV